MSSLNAILHAQDVLAQPPGCRGCGTAAEPALLSSPEGQQLTEHPPPAQELPWELGWGHGPPLSHQDKPSSLTLTAATAPRAEGRSPKFSPIYPFSSQRTLQIPQNLHLLLELSIPPHWPEEAGK